MDEEANGTLSPNAQRKLTKLALIDKIRIFLKSEKFHSIIVWFVVIDCLCVTLELTFEHVEKYVLKNDKHHKQNDHHNLHFYFHLAECILQYASLTILAIFVVEIVVKLVFIPKVFIKSKWEILDAMVVVISFGINIYLLNNKHIIMSIGGLLTLLRLWRITEIVNGNFNFKF